MLGVVTSLTCISCTQIAEVPSVSTAKEYNLDPRSMAPICPSLLACGTRLTQTLSFAPTNLMGNGRLMRLLLLVPKSEAGGDRIPVQGG